MSLRTRLMIIGLAGVGIALIMGGLAFFAALTYSVNRTLDNESLASAEEVAAMVSEIGCRARFLPPARKWSRWWTPSNG